MTRLIDADNIPWFVEGVGDIPVITKEEIDKMPTVDAVPVIRCRNCRWGKETCGNIECNMEYHSYDWYCPNGEREEE